MVIPNSTENHIIAVGLWLCEAVVSLGDPGLSVKVLASQLMDTKAKMIICYAKSRSTVIKALEQIGLMEKVKVICMDVVQFNEIKSNLFSKIQFLENLYDFVFFGGDKVFLWLSLALKYF